MRTRSDTVVDAEIHLAGLPTEDLERDRGSREGIGIDSDEQERVFEVFQRLHGLEGTEIGLAICRRIVERRGGRTRVDSEFDEGATFAFTLPATES